MQTMTGAVVELCLIGLLLLYLVVKPDNLHDTFFKSNRYLNKNKLLSIIGELEKLNNQDYTLMKARAEKYFADNIITDDEYDKIETHLTKIYFQNFEKRFFPFIRSNWSVKTIYIVIFLFTYYYFMAGIHQVALFNEIPKEDIIWWQLGLGVFGCILPITVWFIQLGLLSILLVVLTMIFRNKGSLLRAQITIDEMVRFLKPGGRETPIKLGANNVTDRMWPI